MKVENLKRAAQIEARLKHLDWMKSRFNDLKPKDVLGDSGVEFISCAHFEALLRSSISKIEMTVEDLKAEAETL